MPSFSDSAVIFLLALLLFGPKKLPELARYLGKLMGEFRRASSEFRLQMEDEFRAMEQAEQQQKIAAIEAAAPVAPLNIPEPEHPHLPAPMPVEPQPGAVAEAASATLAATATLEPIPIASNGDLHLMPPASGLPVGRSNFANGSTGSGSLGGLFDTIPHTADPVAMTAPAETEASTHG